MSQGKGKDLKFPTRSSKISGQTLISTILSLWNLEVTHTALKLLFGLRRTFFAIAKILKSWIWAAFSWTHRTTKLLIVFQITRNAFTLYLTFCRISATSGSSTSVIILSAVSLFYKLLRGSFNRPNHLKFWMLITASLALTVEVTLLEFWPQGKIYLPKMTLH